MQTRTPKRLALSTVATVAALAVLCGPSPATRPEPIGWDQLNARPVIGRLGQSLGQVVDVDATVVRGTDLGDKGNAGLYLLRVTTVGGRPLRGPVVIHFAVPGFVHSTLASGEFGLYEQFHGTTTGTLSPGQVAAMEQGYVGRAVRLAVYETGAFSGIPSKLPPDAPVWQDTGFGFQTRLVVLVDRSAER